MEERTMSYQYKTPDGQSVRFCMTPVNQAIAQLQFTDARGSPIDVPEAFTLENAGNTLDLPWGKPSAFFLCWTENYVLLYHDVPIMHINHRREQDVLFLSSSGGAVNDDQETDVCVF
jgi:hypothetical protein